MWGAERASERAVAGCRAEEVEVLLSQVVSGERFDRDCVEALEDAARCCAVRLADAGAQRTQLAQSLLVAGALLRTAVVLRQTPATRSVLCYLKDGAAFVEDVARLRIGEEEEEEEEQEATEVIERDYDDYTLLL